MVRRRSPSSTTLPLPGGSSEISATRIMRPRSSSDVPRARDGYAPLCLAPHSPQNLVPVTIGLPHSEQNCFFSASAPPHSAQNFPGLVFAPHLPHVTWPGPPCGAGACCCGCWCC